MNILKHLAEVMGPRVAGTQGEARAAEFLAGEFTKLGLDTNVQEFTFLNWNMNEPPRLWIKAPVEKEIKVAPYTYSLSTPPNGIVGKLKKIGKMYIIPGYMDWTKYSIIDENNTELGCIVANPNGMAAPISSGKCTLPEACAVIGKDDAREIDDLLESGQEVKVCLYNSGHFVPSQSRNVIGVLGEGLPQVVVCAHYDSVFYAPGAVDNASGIQVVYNIAKRFIEEGKMNKKTIAFIAMGCEEPGLLGSRYYVKFLKEHGLLDHIEFCVNFDMVGKGENFFLRAGMGKGEYLMNILNESNLKIAHDIKLDTAKASSDNWPFNEENIPNVQVVALPFPLYHQSDDTVDQMDTKILSEAEEIGYTLIKELVS
ncbi:M28 family metallopeptidase [Petroclostridium sp. X23]|uniref:M28 family metallopeptidase n=1 Tax=Petroclostridium sp. X23 TaxID=3045146 RepID=UPI0024AD217E|nr:M28 family metallopeptidase [Petroclostridium sp. X23]WHH60488.1 M28 family metallopeptidase [Petroclostridium sp. X23]